MKDVAIEDVALGPTYQITQLGSREPGLLGQYYSRLLFNKIYNSLLVTLKS